MESGRFLVAIVLMIATVVLVNVVFPPARPQARRPATDSAAAPAPAATAPRESAATVAPPAVEQPERPITTAPSPTGRADTIVVESPLYRFGISTRGAALVSAELLNFESQTRRGPVQLAPPNPRGLLSHRIRADDAVYDLTTLDFRADPPSLVLRDGDPAGVVRLSHQDPAAGRSI